MAPGGAAGALLILTVGPVENGPAGLIAALQSAVGPGGTLVMPSMTDDEHIFEPAHTMFRDGRSRRYILAFAGVLRVIVLTLLPPGDVCSQHNCPATS